MIIRDLREAIEDLEDDVSVRIACVGHRSHFEYSICASIEDETEGETVFYLEEGVQIGYLPAAVREELGV